MLIGFHRRTLQAKWAEQETERKRQGQVRLKAKADEIRRMLAEAASTDPSSSTQ